MAPHGQSAIPALPGNFGITTAVSMTHGKTVFGLLRAIKLERDLSQEAISILLMFNSSQDYLL